MRWFSGATLGVCLLAGMARADTYLVLPFFNASHNAGLDWIGESIAETVRETLASEGMLAIAREDRVDAFHRLSIRPYALLTKATVMKIGESLDAEQVVYGEFDLKPLPEGTTGKSRGSLQITARVLDLKKFKEGREFREVGALEELAALQSHLAWQALRSLKPSGAPREAEFSAQHAPIRVDAIENYIRGLLAAKAEDKHRFFTQAARLDPRFSQPNFQLGRLHWQKKEYKVAAEWLQKVPPGDAHYRESNFLLGLCRYYGGDFAGAEASFELVSRSVPLSEVYNNIGAAQSRRDLPGALASFRKALEGDASDPTYQFNVGYALWKQGQFAPAAERFQAVLDHNPSDADAAQMLKRCQKQSGLRPTESRTEGLERLKTNYDESAWLQLKALVEPEKR
jgi:tetratricopeptide (TPR) repeat protein